MPYLTEFTGRPVIDYDPVYSPVEMTMSVYRLRETHDGLADFESLVAQFAQEEDIEEVTALVFGCWNIKCWESMPLDPAVALYRLKDKLPRLSALYVGDIEIEEQEISWIQQTEWGAVLQHFPELDYLHLRGGSGLGLTRFDHPLLETLIIEAHGMDHHLIEHVANARFPSLTTMELWLGTAEDDETLPIDEIKPLFYPDPYEGWRAPNITSLGLVNCGWIDHLLQQTINAPIWPRLTSLDLSQGILTDVGLEALFENDLRQLKQLDVSHGYLTDLTLLEQFRSRGIKVIADELRDPEEYHYVMCWE